MGSTLFIAVALLVSAVDRLIGSGVLSGLVDDSQCAMRPVKRHA